VVLSLKKAQGKFTFIVGYSRDIYNAPALVARLPKTLITPDLKGMLISGKCLSVLVRQRTSVLLRLVMLDDYSVSSFFVICSLNVLMLSDPASRKT
jgi:hypothetical protein